VAVGRAFQAVEQHHEGLARLAVDEVDVDEVAVRRIPAFAAERTAGLRIARAG
jgi:hypothetical protein